MLAFWFGSGVVTVCGVGDCRAWGVVVNEAWAGARADDEDYGDEAWVWGSCD